MAIPDYQTCMLPLLRHLADGQEHPLRDAEKPWPRTLGSVLPSGQSCCRPAEQCFCIYNN